VPQEIGLWRVDGGTKRMVTTGMPLESQLEETIVADPSILSDGLLLIGRQVPTAHGKFVDLLAIDAEGTLHVIELKRERTPREVIAQALDYGSWVETLDHESVLSIFEAFRPGIALEQAFAERFGTPPPEELNREHTLTVVASEVDPATARIVEYLARYEVPLNVVFFRYFKDEDREYLARTWLVDDTRSPAGKATKSSGKRGKTEPWNGQDWYVSFGEGSSTRSWLDARQYGFVSAGGGVWYSNTIRSLPIGGRVFVCIPGAGVGFVGVGTVTGEAMRFDDATIDVDGEATKMSELPLHGTYRHAGVGDDLDEYIVPVSWIETRDHEHAIWEKGFFANQNSACKFRNQFTLEHLTKAFGLDD